MTRPKAEGQVVEWAVYECPNGCMEPAGPEKVTEVVPVFNKEWDPAVLFKDKAFTCSVCGSQLTKTGTTPVIDNARKL